MGTIYVASKRRDVINILIFSLRVPTQLVTTISVIMSTGFEGEEKGKNPLRLTISGFLTTVISA